ncbi:hypothetical protein G7Y79_00021g050060 [Physcia stellaris]|nr:hypothetical protein G7Y79_00021g050060 [Physcia stellaris]
MTSAGPLRADKSKVYYWETLPEYIAACCTEWPGMPTAYDPPRQVGYSPADVTDFKAGQWTWSPDQLPNVLYTLLPSPFAAWQEFRQRQVPYMKTPDGEVVTERWPVPGQAPRKMRYFPILHGMNTIGTQEHPLLLLALRRLDPAITWSDIHMRMPLPGRVSDLGAFDASIYRCFSLPFSLISWHNICAGRDSGAYWADERHRIIRDQLPTTAELMNSTRGYVPGLINPWRGEIAGNRIPWPSNVDMYIGVERASQSTVLAASRIVRHPSPEFNFRGAFGAPVPIPDGMWAANKPAVTEADFSSKPQSSMIFPGQTFPQAFIIDFLTGSLKPLSQTTCENAMTGPEYTVAFKARKKKPWNLTEEMGLRRVRQQLARGARPPIPHCDKTPDYLDAIRRGRRTGDPTEYCDVAQGHCAEDVTTFIVGQAEWSLENLPDILYTLVQPEEQKPWAKSQPPLPYKVTADGDPVMERWPLNNQAENARPLRNIPILPDQICSTEKWWRMEAWRRLDPRVSFADIAMRQMPEQGIRMCSSDIDSNRLARKISRHRKTFCVLNWYGRGSAARLAEKLCEKLSLEQLQKNSTRGTTPGLIDPKKGDVPGNRVPLPGPRNIVGPLSPQPIMIRAPISGPEAPDPRLIHWPTWPSAVARKYVLAPANGKRVQRTPSPPSLQHRQNREDREKEPSVGPDFSDSAMDVDQFEVRPERLLGQIATPPRSRLASRTMSVSNDANAQAEDEGAVSALQSENDEDSEDDALVVLDEMIREQAGLEQGCGRPRRSKPFCFAEPSDEDEDGISQENFSDSDAGSNSSTTNHLEYTVTHTKTGETYSISWKDLKTLIHEEARAEQSRRDEQDVASNQCQSSSEHVMESDTEFAKRLSDTSNDDTWIDVLRPSDEQQLNELDVLIHEADTSEKSSECAGESESNEPLGLPTPHEGLDRQAKNAESAYEDISDSSSSKSSDSPNYDPDLIPTSGGAKKTRENIGITSRPESLKPSQQVVENDLPENAQSIDPSNSEYNPWTEKPWQGKGLRDLIYALPVRQVPEAPLNESLRTASNSERKRKRTGSSKPLRAKTSLGQEVKELQIDQLQDASMRTSSGQEIGRRYNLRQRANNVNKRTIVSTPLSSGSESGSEFEHPERPERRFVLEAINAKREAEQAATRNERFLEAIKAKKRSRRLTSDTECDVCKPATKNAQKRDNIGSRPVPKRSKQDCTVPVDLTSEETAPGRSIDPGSEASLSASFAMPEDAIDVDLTPIGLPFAGLSELSNDVAMMDSDKVNPAEVDSHQANLFETDTHQVNFDDVSSQPAYSDKGDTNSSKEELAGSKNRRPVAPSTPIASTVQSGSCMEILVEETMDLGSRVSSLTPHEQSFGEPSAEPALCGNPKGTLVEEAPRASSSPFQEQPSGKPSASTVQSGNFMNTLVEEVIELGARVSSLQPQDEPSGKPLGRRVDRVAKMVLDLRAGSERLLDEVASLRVVVDGYDRRW